MRVRDTRLSISIGGLFQNDFARGVGPFAPAGRRPRPSSAEGSATPRGQNGLASAAADMPSKLRAGLKRVIFRAFEPRMTFSLGAPLPKRLPRITALSQHSESPVWTSGARRPWPAESKEIDRWRRNDGQPPIIIVGHYISGVVACKSLCYISIDTGQHFRSDHVRLTSRDRISDDGSAGKCHFTSCNRSWCFIFTQHADMAPTIIRVHPHESPHFQMTP
jgi:hypothetical protein